MEQICTSDREEHTAAVQLLGTLQSCSTHLETNSKCMGVQLSEDHLPSIPKTLCSNHQYKTKIKNMIMIMWHLFTIHDRMRIMPAFVICICGILYSIVLYNP